ncbi:MAG: hypothetical protein ACFBSC_08010 [Microcoleaceae cyanobacterium]
MLHSTLSRFQASMVGAIIGIHLVDQGSPLLKLDNDFSGRSTYSDQFQVGLLEEMILRVAQGLILTRGSSVDWSQIAQWPQRGSGKFQAPCLSEAIVAAVPAILLYHESRAALDQNLQQLAQVWWPGQPVYPQVELFCGISHIIAELYQSQLVPRDLIPTLLQRDSSELFSWLHPIQDLIEAAASLDRAIVVLYSQISLDSQIRPFQAEISTVALALYCFLYTPREPQLTVLRALRTRSIAPLAAVISCILSSIYNGLIGLPISWRATLEKQGMPSLNQIKAGSLSRESSQVEQIRGYSNEGVVLQLGTQLFTIWSGSYHKALDICAFTVNYPFVTPRFVDSGSI